MKRSLPRIACFTLLVATCIHAFSQPASKPLTVTAYYAGNASSIDNYDVGKLTHIIYSFCHLKGNRLNVDNAADSATIRKLVSMKKKNPSLKVLLSLGGWGGCAPCSDVFADAGNRKVFAESVLNLCNYFNTDGIDLDWEYPTIQGHPGHKFQPADKDNFTALAKQLRETLGEKSEVTFAAGGFTKYLVEAVDWQEVMKHVDRVYLMTYDLINGYDSVTGHHTALYSTAQQVFSTDNAVQYLVSIGIPRDKLVVGAAFYARVWENVPSVNNGLYQPGKFKNSVGYSRFPEALSEKEGFVRYWDSTAKAPYMYNAKKKLFATYDDEESLKAKTRYAVEQQLSGIMFWQLTHDTRRNGLLDAIHSAIK